ncbi:uncharacterized protein LOC114332130 [Diabrotica virgifera virgifera]|uniref:Uncharacterized protein LOC114332130 n=1 Tax=Diabrotica virgifera virgifera TaxID=50390 RepID=A0A6P7FND7_DIAVI|nr:uncharacterized protein LOC114332130 [Diabrotica virgifera virgifera]
MDVDNEVDISISQLQITASDDTITEVNELNKSSPETTEPSRRSGRVKIRPMKHDKRRVKCNPKRLSEDKAIINYYLDKKIKGTTNLETIFEDPASPHIMSRRKYSRTMNFPVEISLTKQKNKVKKRSLKAKDRGSFKPKKVSMDLLLKKLASIEDGEEC